MSIRELTMRSVRMTFHILDAVADSTRCVSWHDPTAISYRCRTAGPDGPQQLSDAIESALDSVPLADPQETRDEFARRSMCSPVARFTRPPRTRFDRRE
jgi:hypothetical protein